MSNSGPRVAIGIPLYNHAHQLEEALESLLMQSYTDLRIIAVDDGSTDETPQIVQRYAEKDPRLLYFRNEQRLGYTSNANRAFELARTTFPSIEYFAWGSDHDVWHRHWLKLLVERLDREPDAFLASGWAHRIDEHGEIVRSYKFVLPSEGSRPFDRVRFGAHHMNAGILVYGLFRVSALERASGLRLVLVPDRLLLAQLSAYGHAAIVPEYLWYRRYGGLATRRRQRRNSFPAGAPFYSYLPIGMQHFSVLLHDFVIRQRDERQFGRAAGIGLALVYVQERYTRLLTRGARRRLGGARRAASQLWASASDRAGMIRAALRHRAARLAKRRLLLGRHAGK